MSEPTSTRAPPSLPPPELPDLGGDREVLAALEKPYREFREDVERTYVERLLKRHRGNVSAAAQAAGIDRTYIHRLLKKHQR